MVAHSPQAYAATYRQAQAMADEIAASLSDAQFNWKPSPKAWSVGECIEHLSIIGRAYVPVLKEAVSGMTSRAEPPFRYGFVGRLFIKYSSPDSATRLNTAPAMNPNQGGPHSKLDRDASLAEFKSLNEGYLAVCREADGLDLTAARIASPFVPLLRLQVGAMLEGLSVHEIRHLNQARRVTEHPDFPSGSGS